MPKVIQPVKVGKKRYYAVYSTIVMDFVTPFYSSVKQLKKMHPQYKNLKVKNLFGRNNIKGKLNRDGTISVEMKVYKLVPKVTVDICESCGKTTVVRDYKVKGLKNTYIQLCNKCAGIHKRRGDIE